MGGITNETVHLSFAGDWSKEVNPLLDTARDRKNQEVVNKALISAGCNM